MLDELPKILVKLAEFPVLKSVITFVLMFTSFMLGDLYDVEIIAVSMLLTIDFVTGVIGAVYAGESIKSRRMANSVVKALVYYLAISAGKFLDQSIPGEFVQYSTIGFVAVTEFISIIENIGKMGFKTPKALVANLREKYESRNTKTD